MDAQQLITNKAELHEAMVRNGWYMPPRESAIASVAWMKGVRAGTVWCPRYEDARLRPCYKPPGKKQIVDAINCILQDNDADMGLTYANAPKDSWLLVVLATISPGHAFFTKGYVPERLYREPALVDNTDGFLTGLPLKVRVAQKMYYQPANLYPNGVGSGQYGNGVASGQISNGVASGQISSSIPSDDNNKHAANP
jgi:hypothetical protein